MHTARGVRIGNLPMEERDEALEGADPWGGPRVGSGLTSLGPRSTHMS